VRDFLSSEDRQEFRRNCTKLGLDYEKDNQDSETLGNRFVRETVYKLNTGDGTIYAHLRDEGTCEHSDGDISVNEDVSDLEITDVSIHSDYVSANLSNLRENIEY
jgi:hypothetical protein